MYEGAALYHVAPTAEVSLTVVGTRYWRGHLQISSLKIIIFLDSHVLTIVI